MKETWLTLIAALTFATADAATIVQWNFNSVPPDSTSNTGTTNTSVGVGTIGVVGTVIPNVSATQQYSSGNGSSDPATTDDSAFHTRNYPLQGDSNKTSGIEIHASTVGFESIVVSWDQQNSPAANKYLRFQYSLDGSTFVDYGPAFTMNISNTFVNGKSVLLTPIVAANGNPNFAFRLVSEFESTATGAGSAAYVATGVGSTYSQNGTMRFDMVTISGSLPDGNSFPTIGSIPNQTVRVDTATDPLPFQVNDLETPAEQLLVTGSSSNPTLVSDAAIIIEGTGSYRTVTVQPNFDQTGQATITLWVTDGGGKSNSTSFVLTVIPGNTPPSISSFTNVHTLVNTAFTPINFTVSDAEESASTLVVTAVSSDQTVISDANLVFSGSGADRTLTMTPFPDQVGNAVITVTVTDSGYLSASQTLNAMVLGSDYIVFSEPFNYVDGPLVSNSGRLWTTRTGTPNQMQMASSTVLVTGSQSEDVTARLINGPYDTNGSTVLYASFDVSFIGLPTGAPDIFAHFSGTNPGDLRARVLTSVANAAQGSFRLAVANTTSSAPYVVDYPLDLNLDTVYQVVVAYDVAKGTSKLWVNPADGGDWVSAIDPVQPIAIDAYGLRQPGPGGRIGDMRIDNLVAGLSFEAVTPNLTRVRIYRDSNSVEVYWPSGGIWAGTILESTPSLENPNWQPVSQAAVPENGWDVVIIENPTENQFFRLRKSN